MAVALDEGAGPEVPVKEDVRAREQDSNNYGGNAKKAESNKEDVNKIEDDQQGLQYQGG